MMDGLYWAIGKVLYDRLKKGRYKPSNWEGLLF